jgi:nucleoside-diphosphate-sugar epimerase
VSGGTKLRVFVAGASGALGRPLLPQLLAAGHQVVGMTRREEAAEAIRAAGAEAVVCDVYDGDALRSAMAAAKPDAVIHALTALPQRFKPREDYLAATNRVRTEGTRNLISGARAAGAKRLLAESVAFFYEPTGGWVKDEGAPLMSDPPGRFKAGAAALKDLESQVLGAAGLEGLVLRFGWLYGDGTYYASDGTMAEETRRRRNPIVGSGTGTFSFVHVEDAAAAFVAALQRGAHGVYNVVDDEPARLSEWLPVYARALGAKPPRRVPGWLAGLVAGRDLTQSALSMRGASNAKAKRELGWTPAHPSWRRGFADSLG